MLPHLDNNMDNDGASVDDTVTICYFLLPLIFIFKMELAERSLKRLGYSSIAIRNIEQH